MANLILIDDNPDDREWIERHIRETGEYTIYPFSTGAAGLDHFRQHGADCVLLDRRLGAEDGLAVLSMFRMQTLFCPVIMLTGDEDENLTAAATRAGAERCLAKGGLTAATLSEAIGDALHSAEEARKRAGLSANIRRLIVIDDNADDRLLLRETIQSVDPRMRIFDFAKSREAIDHVKTRGADCVLLDYRLEAEDGLAVLATFRAIAPALPVVMLTGQGNEEVAATSIRVGAADYRIKNRETGASICAAIENAIRRAALETRVADQDAERKRFLQVLVHDLRAPLRRVSLMGELAVEEAEIGALEKLKSVIGGLRATAQRADALIEALHSYAMLDQPVTFAPTSLAEAAAAARDNLRHDIETGNAQVSIGDLPMIDGDAPQLVQLMQNLIQNGLRYNRSEHPAVAIETEVEAEAADSSVIVVVRDNGIGIPAKHLRSIFAPLKRLWPRDQYDGAGLGLATCQKVVERHGGAIWCTSTEGEGSAFHIRFPLPH